MLNVYKAKPDAAIIGLIPPNYDEWLRRLRGREVMADQEFLNRLRTADKVLENMLEHSQYTLVINDDLEGCVQDVRAVVEFGTYSEEQNNHARSVAAELHVKVKQALEQFASK
jgi:guanylate kinase